ncbi:MAG: cupin domain-containing protein [Lunatimonas sp.]|uniref:cupin domain-containing protein n=1 Tax=Lunatimonas sp. TaxID=2060141 RepID=UPI00263B8A76|nr:cupin domain-containing protein [Lunatimonas sp.]MCC5938009.1 cupin domain-containing protein [Lunatimonas sp.]
MEKSKVMVMVDMLEYIPDTIESMAIIRKATGEVTASSFDTGKSWLEQRSAFDVFVQVIDGEAVILINNVAKVLLAGESIIIPAHASCSFKAKERFKMISTVIKSGYDEVGLGE